MSFLIKKILHLFIKFNNINIIINDMSFKNTTFA